VEYGFVTFHTLSIYTHTHTQTGLDSVVLKEVKKCLPFWSSGSKWPHVKM